jgi:hypothetical protein
MIYFAFVLYLLEYFLKLELYIHICIAYFESIDILMKLKFYFHFLL